MPLVKVYDAATVLRHLNGIVNIYKPANMSLKKVKEAVLHNITRDLNEMQVREPRKIEKEIPLLEPGGAANPVLRKIETLDLSDHLLSTGPRYIMNDIRCVLVAGLGYHTSGVLLFGMNRGKNKASKIQKNRPIRTYHVSGRLGTATENHFPDSLTTVKSNYKHVHPERVSALAASMQASHQRKMFELCGVDIQSQAAYEIACKGAVRPADNSQPVIYGIKLIEFNRPDFMLEVHAINENENYLATLVHEMGIELRSVAHCTGIRCIRHGQFSADTALLRHGWTLAGVMKSLREQKKVLEEHPYLLNQKIQLHN
ncbi:mitochondrial mRNA pseudouridine synthase Trub2-like [Teleopsis dalmanni]|uniref:mitochondrial mRNA pseudouridine synthase Trub2-like n=1 Tax=Teleopsis dalmanni TaxID=139649 RepID=UPI0018CF695A|nr:mitochondrial mRNA pseudouridine synthase Trub2-like [Teleopsis dalmanni]